jgi:hypothetical protein
MKRNILGEAVKRSRLEDLILERWKLLDAEQAFWYCISFFFGFLVTLGTGVMVAQYSLGLAT